MSISKFKEFSDSYTPMIDEDGRLVVLSTSSQSYQRSNHYLGTLVPGMVNTYQREMTMEDKLRHALAYLGTNWILHPDYRGHHSYLRITRAKLTANKS